VSRPVKLSALIILAALACALAPAAEAQTPIRIGTTLAKTGVYASAGQNLLHGYQLCVKRTNERGGVLGRKLELLVLDDTSDPATAARLYENFIMRDKADLVLGPFPADTADAVANVTEKHRMPMVVPASGATSIYRKGRKFVFSMYPPGEVHLEGLIDLAAKKGLKTVALLNVDDLGGRAVEQGGRDLAKKKGLLVVFAGTYPNGTTDFSPVVTKIRAANPDVLVGTYNTADAVAIVSQLKASDVSPRMFGLDGRAASYLLPKNLGRDAEFIYGAIPWLPELLAVRAGGLIPIARQYPGVREFIEAYRKEFSGADPNFLVPAGYGGCQILVEAVRRAGSLDGAKLRDAILKMNHNTVFGAFRVDPGGLQIGHRFVIFQWQEGKKAIVWPEELAPATPRFPTPPWSQRP
jgi:branched-chain amino acid transport system substrate-binding protein